MTVAGMRVDRAARTVMKRLKLELERPGKEYHVPDNPPRIGIGGEGKEKN